MVSKNLVEQCTGLRFQSSHHWDQHWVVGLSALCFAVPSAAFLTIVICIGGLVERPYSTSTAIQLALYSILWILYTACVAACALADYVYIRRGHRSYFGKIDIRLASLTFFVSIFDFALRASLLETSALVLAAISAFAFSGLSSSFQQWIFRHTFWHVAAGAIATYGALRLPPEETKIEAHVLQVAAALLTLYGVVAGVVLAAFLVLTDATRRLEIWTFGAQFADWEPVAPEFETFKTDVEH